MYKTQSPFLLDPEIETKTPGSAVSLVCLAFKDKPFNSIGLLKGTLVRQTVQRHNWF